MKTPHNTNPAILKQKIKENFSVSSWNDLTDKPFGEITVNGDTLTWDGNSEGLESFDMGDVTTYLVSNAIITYDDIKNGYAIVLSNGETYESDAEATKSIWEKIGFMYGPSFAIIPTDNFIFADLNFTFPKAGVYFWDDGESYCASLTIPGYTGFESTTVKTIDEKYLPFLTSPSGKKFKLSVDDSGVLSATEVTE